MFTKNVITQCKSAFDLE